MATLPGKHAFYPGDIAPASGVYRVLHRGHRGDHRVLIIKGDEFPRCRRCSHHVSFELMDPIQYAPQEWDFAGPNLRLVK